jgi:hypothetical protein
MSQEPNTTPDEEQLDMFGAAPVAQYRPDPEKVRARLHSILDEARAANVIPWRPAKLSLYRSIFPQMARYLPADEGKQLCFQFEEELARLEAA